MSTPVYVDDQVTSEIELEVQELEEIIAPRLAANHNEMLVGDVSKVAERITDRPFAPRPAWSRAHR